MNKSNVFSNDCEFNLYFAFDKGIFLRVIIEHEANKAAANFSLNDLKICH